MQEVADGRIFFSHSGRGFETEELINLTTIGVDVGSTTSHILFSRLQLERQDNRYLVTRRVTLHRSDIALTPYGSEREIDESALGRLVEKAYDAADLHPSDIDSGALILTGHAVERRNARAVGNLFAAQAGRLVAVSAGDGLEAALSAHGSGAVARSARTGERVLSVDVGGGTSKIALCVSGKVEAATAIDVGARVVRLAADNTVLGIERATEHFARVLGHPITPGERLSGDAIRALAMLMSETLLDAIQGQASGDSLSLYRLPPLCSAATADLVLFSGGVSSFMSGAVAGGYGDLGAQLAAAILDGIGRRRLKAEIVQEGIRATVIGASQHTVQVSGSTIFVSPASAVPIRNAAVLELDEVLLADEVIDADRITDAIGSQIGSLSLQKTDHPVAISYRWSGLATFNRLDAFARGAAVGLAERSAHDRPIILVGHGDVGGLLGMHLKETIRIETPIVSIDGVAARTFDFLDIGSILPGSGAVPVVIKSLIFPNEQLGT